MNTASKDLTDRAGIKPRLQLGRQVPTGDGDKTKVVSTGPHRVKWIGDRIIKGQEYQSDDEIDVVEYTFEEGGEEKLYEASVKNKKGELHYFVKRMSEYEYGQELILEMRKKGIRSYISIVPVQDDSEEPVQYDDQQATNEDS
ncbi:hypothetical protein IH992_31370 [Candidatus Poribacteria bacterium]|nr:hypothetical protein [Candidatus Poribacteria bacterium]